MTGRWWCLEGGDGVGKTSHAKVLANDLQAMGREVVHVREPGGTPYGEEVRKLLLSRVPMGPRALILAFMSCRAQLIEEIVEPALREDVDVVMERYVASTYAYNAIDDTTAEMILGLHGRVFGHLNPDKTIILDLDPVVATQRINRESDRFESRGLVYQAAVRDRYRDFVKHCNRGTCGGPHSVVILDANGTFEEVHLRILEVVKGSIS